MNARTRTSLLIGCLVLSALVAPLSVPSGPAQSARGAGVATLPSPVPAAGMRAALAEAGVRAALIGHAAPLGASEEPR